ncbi:uncharacterized [Tachysurus ichikawai]
MGEQLSTATGQASSQLLPMPASPREATRVQAHFPLQNHTFVNEQESHQAFHTGLRGCPSSVRRVSWQERSFPCPQHFSTRMPVLYANKSAFRNKGVRLAEHLSPTAIPHSPAQIAEQAASPALIPKSLSRQPSVDNYTLSRQAGLGCGARIGPDLTLAPSALRSKTSHSDLEKPEPPWEQEQLAQQGGGWENLAKGWMRWEDNRNRECKQDSSGCLYMNQHG